MQGAVVVLMGPPSAQPGNNRVHERARRGPHLGHFMALAAVMAPPGSETYFGGQIWALRHGCGGGSGAERGDMNVGALERWNQ